MSSTYHYLWQNSKLYGAKATVASSGESVVINYLYDGDEVIGIYLNDTVLLYIKNIQGDIVSVVNTENNEIVLNYYYDAWGNISYESSDSVVGAIISALVLSVTNFSYRGYFCDYETGLYYLQSRYYDPEVGRFINLDDTEIAISTKGELFGSNLFIYCCNNSINESDPSGYWSRQYLNYFFVYDKPGSDFKKQAKWMAKYAYNNKNVRYIYIDKISEFRNWWNSLSSQNISNIHLFLHGGPDILHFNSESMSGNSIAKLSKLTVKGKVYLFSCHGGTKSNNNCVAWRFAKLVNKKAVRAVVNGSVYYRAWYQLTSYKPLTKEKNAYWADFKYTNYKGKMMLTENSIGKSWYL